MVGSVFMSIATYVVFIWKSIKSNHEKDEEAVLSKRNYTVMILVMIFRALWICYITKELIFNTSFYILLMSYIFVWYVLTY